MATRDRYGGFSEPAPSSQLVRYIMNACVPPDGSTDENLALFLEITDLINTKQGNAYVETFIPGRNLASAPANL